MYYNALRPAQTAQHGVVAPTLKYQPEHFTPNTILYLNVKELVNPIPNTRKKPCGGLA